MQEGGWSRSDGLPRQRHCRFFCCRIADSNCFYFGGNRLTGCVEVAKQRAERLDSLVVPSRRIAGLPPQPQCPHASRQRNSSIQPETQARGFIQAQPSSSRQPVTSSPSSKIASPPSRTHEPRGRRSGCFAVLEHRPGAVSGDRLPAGCMAARPMQPAETCLRHVSLILDD